MKINISARPNNHYIVWEILIVKFNIHNERYIKHEARMKIQAPFSTMNRVLE